MSYTKKLKSKIMYVIVRISVLPTGCISEGIPTISPVFKSKGFLMQDILVISSSTLVSAETGHSTKWFYSEHVMLIYQYKWSKN